MIIIDVIKEPHWEESSHDIICVGIAKSFQAFRVSFLIYAYSLRI